MRILFALLLLAALAAPSHACDGWGGHAGYRGYGYRSYAQPYWHHPYYARFGYQRPYLFYRQLRYFGYAGYLSGPFGGGMYGGCGGDFYFYSYYPRYISVAPVYTRLGTALSLDDTAFVRRDRDGLPRSRTGPVGKRFLADTP